MSLVFLSPWFALVALGGVAPLAAVALAERRTRRVLDNLDLPPNPFASRALHALAIAAAAVLLGLAASQPVLAHNRTQKARKGIEALFVIDNSRSMLASDGPDGEQRMERAKAIVARLRAAIPDVRAGLASLSDRVLPYVLPTIDGPVFAATLDRSVGIERPPPLATLRTKPTGLAALASLPSTGYFPPGVSRRLLVVVTDGESQPVDATSFADALRRPPRFRLIFVHVWRPGEKVYQNDVAEIEYRTDPGSNALLARVAAAAGGRAFEENQLGAAEATLHTLAGRGARVEVGSQRTGIDTAPYAALAALLPLGLVLVRRNL